MITFLPILHSASSKDMFTLVKSTLGGGIEPLNYWVTDFFCLHDRWHVQYSIRKIEPDFAIFPRYTFQEKD